MSFDIFGSSQKDTISVGYISTDRGYIQNVNIKDANLYAQKNPGTQFIFTTRNFVKYLNINEVNKLEVKDLLANEKTCEGIVIEKQGEPPKALFSGGGGVGALGNPIIGTDGAVLAVDLIAGGFGYQYEPIVVIKDDTGVGAGAVVRAILGEVVQTVEYFDQESDFEIYDIGGSNTGSGTGSGAGGIGAGGGCGIGAGAGGGGIGACAGGGGIGAGGSGAGSD